MTIITKKSAAKELLHRREAIDSLLKFIEYTHPSWETSTHHVILCAWLEKLESGEIERLAVFAPPRHGKTEVV